MHPITELESGEAHLWNLRSSSDMKPWEFSFLKYITTLWIEEDMW